MEDGKRLNEVEKEQEQIEENLKRLAEAQQRLLERKKFLEAEKAQILNRQIREQKKSWHLPRTRMEKNVHMQDVQDHIYSQ